MTRQERLDAGADLLVHCAACGHTWSAARLPMEAGKVAKLTRRLACPRCAAGGKALLMATKAQAVEWARGEP